MKYQIREIKEEDALSTARTISRSVRPSLADAPEHERKTIMSRYTAEYVREKAAKGKFFIAVSNAKVFGVIGLIGDEVRTFYVDPGYQGRGIGRALFNRLEAYAVDNGIKQLTVKSSPVAKDVYAKFGFKVKSVKREKINGREVVNYWMSKSIR